MQMVGADFHNPVVGAEYKRWVESVGPADPYISKYTIGLHEVLQAHFLLVDFFHDIGEGLGGVGPKSVNLLHSALSRQFAEFGGQSKWNDRILICASLMYGLIKNHPFHDANKRTAFLSAILHLQKIGRTPIVSQKEFEDFTVNVSNSSLQTYYGYDKYDGMESDREVAFMAYFLKKSTRQIDLTSKQITYNDLNALLARRGMFLDNPKNCRIDLMLRVELDGTHLSAPKRIAKIGFHGWSREVSRRDIEIVREASKLDARHGYDSQAFFNGLDDPMTLIKKYKEPLERLAFR